jgi:hypothetical protein
MVCLRNITVDTLHKGNTEDDDDDDDDDNNNNNNSIGPTGKYLQQLQKHQAKVTGNECSHLV